MCHGRTPLMYNFKEFRLFQWKLWAMKERHQAETLEVARAYYLVTICWVLKYWHSQLQSLRLTPLSKPDKFLKHNNIMPQSIPPPAARRSTGTHQNTTSHGLFRCVCLSLACAAEVAQEALKLLSEVQLLLKWHVPTDSKVIIKKHCMLHCECSLSFSELVAAVGGTTNVLT